MLKLVSYCIIFLRINIKIPSSKSQGLYDAEQPKA